jgi:hypothetical protein
MENVPIACMTHGCVSFFSVERRLNDDNVLLGGGSYTYPGYFPGFLFRLVAAYVCTYACSYPSNCASHIQYSTEFGLGRRESLGPRQG